jgi:formylglycine-generating enzyme required for sulfatase activity
LDTELRLVTPADLEGSQTEGTASVPTDAREKYYLLTHDYLVPSLRQWLTRQDRGSIQGRATLKLKERAELWNARPENRQLPSFWEWLQISALARTKKWTEGEKCMMHRATRFHLACLGLVLAVLIIGAWGLRESYAALHANELVRNLLSADAAAVPETVRNIQPYRDWAEPILTKRLSESDMSGREALRARLALVPNHPDQSAPLREGLLQAEPAEVVIISQFLQPYREASADYFWEQVENAPTSSRRFRAACALAALDPANKRWREIAGVVAEQLVTENQANLRLWLDAFAPVSRLLLTPLARIFRESGRPAERARATDVILEYAKNEPELLADLTLDADPEQFQQLVPLLKAHGERAVELFRHAINLQAPSEEQVTARDTLARQQAQAAVALVQLGRPELVWSLLKHSPDPSRRSYLIHGLPVLGTSSGVVIDRLLAETDTSARRALILCLGGYDNDGLSGAERHELSTLLLRWYENDPDPGIHSAIDWLLRRDQQGGVTRRVKWEQREPLTAIDSKLAGKPVAGRGWYVSKEGLTLAIVPRPVEFLMGSPVFQPDRKENEAQHRRRIPRSMAIATKEITNRQFQVFLDANPAVKNSYVCNRRYNPDDDCPALSVTWFEAAQYCNWLSEREGIPKDQWCYGSIRMGKDTIEMELPRDYLHRTGYRLPTEAEWEYVCRAGAVTARFYGSSEQMLGEYAWYSKTTNGRRTWPVGQLRPNDFGLFDIYGNAVEWCQDEAKEYPDASNDAVSIDQEEPQLRVLGNVNRIARGDSFVSHAFRVQSSERRSDPAANRNYTDGFRVARTLTSGRDVLDNRN